MIKESFFTVEHNLYFSDLSFCLKNKFVPSNACAEYLFKSQTSESLIDFVARTNHKGDKSIHRKIQLYRLFGQSLITDQKWLIAIIKKTPEIGWLLGHNICV